MKVYTTAPLEDPRAARTLYRELERIGYDGAFSFEAKHDPFLTLAVAAEDSERLRLGTAIAIAFARNPMNLANLGYDMQVISGGRFVLGLGTQVRPHIEKRFSATWSKPARRLREMGARHVLIKGGHRVTAIARDPEKAEKLRAKGATPVVAELGLPKLYVPLLKAADAVVHTAFESPPRGVQVDRLAIETMLAAAKAGRRSR